MTFVEKLKSVLVPSLLAIGFGVLQIKYPDAMGEFDDNYTGRGTSGLFVLIIELLLVLTWGKLGGFFAIAVGLLIILNGILSTQTTSPEPLSTEETDNVESNLTSNVSTAERSDVRQKILRIGIRAGKNYIQQQRSKSIQD